MTNYSSIKLFDERKIRVVWDDKQEKWYFSVVDGVAALTGQTNYQEARNYWKVLKNRLLKEGNDTITNCKCLANGDLKSMLQQKEESKKELIEFFKLLGYGIE